MAKPAVQIQPLSINRLNGRELRIDNPSGRRIVLIYGIHSSLERMTTTAEFLSDYGQVRLPDMPGIGGMTSFYAIGREPTLDMYADYLYTYLKVSQLDKSLTFVAMSFGFLVVTRMFQKYPQTESWTDDVISFVGFGRASDFKHLARSRRWYVPLSRLLSTRAGGWFARRVVFSRLGLRAMFAVFKLFNPKYQHAMATRPVDSLKMELDLWQANDARTRFALYKLLFQFDLTGSGQVIDVPLHDLTTFTDQYLEPAKVAATLKRLYAKVDSSRANLAVHAPSIIGDKDEVSAVFSDEVKARLSS